MKYIETTNANYKKLLEILELYRENFEDEDISTLIEDANDSADDPKEFIIK